MNSVFFFKQKTAYEMRISDWSSDVCSSDLRPAIQGRSTSCAALRASRLVIACANASWRSCISDRARSALRVIRSILSLSAHDDTETHRAAQHRLRNRRPMTAWLVAGWLMTGSSCSPCGHKPGHTIRSEEHKSELQSLMRIPYAVFCL